MMRIIAAAFLALALSPTVSAQQTTPPSIATEAVDTSYRPSPTISARLQRQFLTDIRWSAGVEMRDRLSETFAETSPVEIWEELVAGDGLTSGNVVDALTSFWVLNWIAANGAYGTKIDNGPVRRQLQLAFASDPAFAATTDQRRQELAEGYILDFLVLHAQLNAAVETRDVPTLNRLAAASVARFRQDMRVDLRGLLPGPDGFEPRPQR